MHRFREFFPYFPVDDGPAPAPPGAAARVDSLGPYLAALGFGAVATVLAVALTDVPTAPLVGIATIFAALAVATRRLRELPGKPGSALARRACVLCRKLDDLWGLEFYGLAAVSAFIWLEAGSLVRLQPAESLANVAEAAIWWYPMWTQVGEPLGAATFVLLLSAAWTFWFVLGVHPEAEPWLN